MDRFNENKLGPQEKKLFSLMKKGIDDCAPDPEFRAELFKMLAEKYNLRKKMKENEKIGFIESLRLFFQRPVFNYISIVTAVLVMVMVFGGTTAYAYLSPEVTRLNTLYPLKILVEEMEYRLAFSEKEKIEKRIHFANRRKQELETLFVRGKRDQFTVNAITANLYDAQDLAKKIEDPSRKQDFQKQIVLTAIDLRSDLMLLARKSDKEDDQARKIKIAFNEDRLEESKSMQKKPLADSDDEKPETEKPRSKSEQLQREKEAGDQSNIVPGESEVMIPEIEIEREDRESISKEKIVETPTDISTSGKEEKNEKSEDTEDVRMPAYETEVSDKKSGDQPETVKEDVENVIEELAEIEKEGKISIIAYETDSSPRLPSEEEQEISLKKSEKESVAGIQEKFKIEDKKVEPEEEVIIAYYDEPAPEEVIGETMTGTEKQTNGLQGTVSDSSPNEVSVTEEYVIKKEKESGMIAYDQPPVVEAIAEGGKSNGGSTRESEMQTEMTKSEPKVSGSEKVIFSCKNECQEESGRRCSGSGYQICGDYDDDSCLEWGETNECPCNTQCKSGVCKKK